MKKRINPELKIDGILITMCNQRTNLSKEIISMITDAYGKHIRIFENKIPSSVKVGEANYKNQSISQYKPNNKVALAYNNFVEEYIHGRK